MGSTLPFREGDGGIFSANISVGVGEKDDLEQGWGSRSPRTWRGSLHLQPRTLSPLLPVCFSAFGLQGNGQTLWLLFPNLPLKRLTR